MKQTKPTYVLGTGLSHDGSACLLKDGIICVAIEKERITRRKHDGGNDTAAIQYCLEAEGITLKDVSLIVQNANFGMFKHGNRCWNQHSRIVDGDAPVVTISHHLAHAYSAVGTSSFREAAILVVDGCGSSLDDCMDMSVNVPTENPPAELRHLYFEKDSYYIYKDEKMIPVFKDFSPWGINLKQYPMHPNSTLHSIGGLYLAVSTYIFRGFEDAGKLMGLAPYGHPGKYDFEIFDLRNGRVFVRYDWMDQFNDPCLFPEQFKENFQYYADTAYWVQKELERAILYIVNSRYEMSPFPNLAYAGGVALNAVANRRIVTETNFENVYIQPAAGDNGLAVGCAFYGWLEVLKRERILDDGSMALGKTYQSQVLHKALDACEDDLQFSNSEDYIKKTAELLAEGKTVGWFQDGAEFGPRALGNRSILADPRRPEMRDFINSKIKFREDFRPFAPSVIAEDAATYFDCDYASPYMILTAPVRPEWRERLPSVIHCDQSARIQTVTADANPKYYQLLRAFKELTGISVLLNTSFNRKGMPIVETPQEAVEFFLKCELDVLVLHNYIIYKKTRQAEKSFCPDKFFNQRLKDTFQRHAPKISRLKGIYQINVTNTKKWVIDLNGDSPQILENNTAKNADIILEINEKELRALSDEPENVSNWLFSIGKLKVSGNRAYLRNITKIFRLR